MKVTASLFLALGLSAAASGATLEEKLSAQFARWDAARTRLTSGTDVTRAEWESALALPATLELNDADRAALRTMHANEIAQAKQAATANSPLSLVKVRETHRVKEFCAKLPKGGMLHIHPWGTLDDATLDAILSDVNPLLKVSKLQQMLDETNPANGAILYASELAFLDQFTDLTRYSMLTNVQKKRFRDFFFLPEGVYPFKRFMAPFTLTSALLFSDPQKDPSPKMWDALFKRAAEQKLSYVEISGTAFAKVSWLDSLASWQQGLKSKYGVQGSLLAAFLRHQDPTKLRTQSQALLEVLNQVGDTHPARGILRGVNLVADESLYPALEKGQGVYGNLMASTQARAAAGLKPLLEPAIHAGELGDVRNLRDAVIFGSRRIGHGVKFEEDPVALEYARRQSVAIEVNLSSNQRLGVKGEVSAHPFLNQLRLGLPASLSTDDEGIFMTDLDHECELAIAETDLTYDELKRMVLNSIRTSFANEPDRAQLLANLQVELVAFENNWLSTP